MPRVAPPHRLAGGPTTACVLALALALALASCADNPAFKSSGEPVATTTDVGASSTGEPAPCPNDQPLVDYYPDADADSYGDRKADPTPACAAPDGMVPDRSDCNDKVPEIRPMVIEQCNGVDDNCNQLVDESSPDCGACTVELTQSFVYWICPEKQAITWDEAAARCTKRSFKTPVRLTSVHDQAEYDFLRAHLVKFDAVNDEKHVWIGLRKGMGPDETCAVPSPDTDWTWHDGTPVDFTAWLAGEPDNGLCDAPNKIFENCAELQAAAQPGVDGWNDIACDAPARGYICKTLRDMVLFPD